MVMSPNSFLILVNVFSLVLGSRATLAAAAKVGRMLAMLTWWIVSLNFV